MIVPTQTPLQVETLTSRIATLVRQNIIDLTPGFTPGSRLNPRELARQLGVSETPFKMALQELATLGLVEILPRRGTFVSKLSRRDVDELITVRAGLEVMALRIANAQFRPEILEQMLESVRECEQALEEGDSEKYRRHDALFHSLIVEAASNRRLKQIYESLTGSVQILNVYNPRHRSQQLTSQQEHRALVALFREGDLTRSETALADHWQRSQERLLAAYSPHLTGDEA